MIVHLFPHSHSTAYSSSLTITSYLQWRIGFLGPISYLPLLFLFSPIPIPLLLATFKSCVESALSQNSLHLCNSRLSTPRQSSSSPRAPWLVLPAWRCSVGTGRRFGGSRVSSITCRPLLPRCSPIT